MSGTGRGSAMCTLLLGTYARLTHLLLLALVVTAVHKYAAGQLCIYAGRWAIHNVSQPHCKQLQWFKVDTLRASLHTTAGQSHHLFVFWWLGLSPCVLALETNCCAHSTRKWVALQA